MSRAGPRLLLLALLLSTPARLGADDALDALLAKLQERQKGLRTLAASLDQTRRVSLLDRPARARGRLLVRWGDAGGRRACAVRWELTEPEPVVHLLRADRLLTLYPADREAERMALPPTFAPFLDFVGAPVVTPAHREQFEVSTLAAAGPAADGAFRFPEEEKAPGAVGLVFRPRNEKLGKVLREVRLLLDAEKLWVTRLAVLEPNGDRTEVAFTDVRENVPAPDNAFEPDLNGYTVREGN